MSIVNRRNAVLGWAVWTTAKRAAKMKARNMTPGIENRRPNAPLLAATFAGFAGAAGALAFWRKQHTAEEA